MECLPTTADDFFFSGLSPKDLNTFARTSKANLARALAFKRRAFNIENLLKRFFLSSEVASFRCLQAKTQMFISGSTALQFFDLTEYPNSDLDLYVEHHQKDDIIDWLIKTEYQYHPQGGQTLAVARNVTFPDYTRTGRGVANVYNFYKQNPERKIQLITAHHSPLAIVLRFHSTCVMNIITHEKAYALYPKATFEQRRSLMYSTEGINQEAARQKYIARGWTLVESQFDAEVNGSTSAFKPGLRYVGDSQCWTVDLYPTLNLPGSLIQINSWELKFNDDGKPLLSFSNITRPKLLHSYICSYRPYNDWHVIRLALKSFQTSEPHDTEILALLRERRLIET